MAEYFVRTNMENNCEACWPRVNALVQASGLPALDAPAWTEPPAGEARP